MGARMEITSNIDEVCAWLEAVVAGFDFTIPGIDQSLGRDIVVEAATGIAARSADGRAPDGSPWAPNSDNPPGKGYKSRKARDYGVFDLPNHRTGQMCSLLSLVGRPEIAEQSIRMVYGIGEPPSTSAAPTGYLSEADETITDVEKAQFAHADGREFYGLDDEIIASIYGVCAEALGKYIGEANR